MLPVFFTRWCGRYAAHFTAVGAVFYTTARVNAPRLSTVGVGVMLPNFTAVGAAVYTTKGNGARFQPLV